MTVLASTAFFLYESHPTRQTTIFLMGWNPYMLQEWQHLELWFRSLQFRKQKRKESLGQASTSRLDLYTWTVWKRRIPNKFVQHFVSLHEFLNPPRGNGMTYFASVPLHVWTPPPLYHSISGWGGVIRMTYFESLFHFVPPQIYSVPPQHNGRGRFSIMFWSWTESPISFHPYGIANLGRSRIGWGT